MYELLKHPTYTAYTVISTRSLQYPELIQLGYTIIAAGSCQAMNNEKQHLLEVLLLD